MLRQRRILKEKQKYIVEERIVLTNGKDYSWSKITPELSLSQAILLLEIKEC